MSDEQEVRDETQIHYVFFSAGTGHIQQVGASPRWMLSLQEQHLETGVDWLETDDPATVFGHYIALPEKKVTARPANPATLDGMKISNVPNPSAVTIDGGEPVTVTDGEVELEFTQPGTFVIQVSSWPMLDATFTVTQP